MSSSGDLTVHPAVPSGRVRVPASKSHSVRALVLAAFADAPSTIRNLLSSGDTASCRSAIVTLGARVTDASDDTTRVEPIPVTRRHIAGAPPDRVGPRNDTVLIDVGNSGTTLYLLTALAAHLTHPVRFDGDDSLRSRNAGPLLAMLASLGADIPALAGSRDAPDATQITAPYTISGPLTGGRRVAVYSPTSQYLSALLLAAPLIPGGGTTGVTEFDIELLHERPYVDMTCSWLDTLGIRYRREGYDRFTVETGQRYPGFETTLPGDWSSATFWFCAGAITGVPVTVDGLDRADVQGDRAVLSILEQLGCSVTVAAGQDGAASVTVRGPLRRGGSFDLNAIPDALPALAVTAAYAPEPVHLGNVPQARAKETDRIAVMAAELGKLGVTVREQADGMTVAPARPRGGTISSHGDHRVAMAFAIAALAAEGPVTIHDAACAAVTYPAFFDHLAHLASDALAGSGAR